MASTAPAKAASPAGRRSPSTYGWAAAVLLLTLFVSLVWSHFRLFWVDELLEFLTDSKPTVGAILWGQLHAPFSLEPPLFHLLLHGALKLLPGARLACRALSILSLLVTELCAFALTRRLTGRGLPALLAMSFPFLLVSIDYAPEARNYSFQLALLAVACVCYQRLVTDQPAPRWYAGLTASLGCLVLTHYFGIVVASPLWAGELARTLHRRRLDPRMLTALAFGTALIVFDLPFAHALRPFRTHYYNTGETSWWMVPFTYLWLKYHFAIYFLPANHIRRTYALGLGSMAIVVLAAAAALRRTRGSEQSVVIVLCVAAALPVLNLIVAQFARAYVPRYSLPAIIGISVLLALLLDQLLPARTLPWVVAAILVWGCLYAGGQIRTSRALKLRLLGSGLTPAQQQVLASLKDRHIYVQDTAKYLVLNHYRTEPFSGLRSASCELKWDGRNSDSLFGANMAQTVGLSFPPFSTIYANSNPHMILFYGDGANEWIFQEFLNDHAQLTRLGGAFGGELALIRFPYGQTCDQP